MASTCESSTDLLNALQTTREFLIDSPKRQAPGRRTGAVDPEKVGGDGTGIRERRKLGGMNARSDASPPVPEPLDAVDRRIAGFMRRWGIVALRVSLGVIFIWFGILKPLGLSPAAPLVRATVDWMPLLAPDTWVAVIGWWEVLIGVTFLFHRTVRIAIALLAMQMVGTVLPLVMLPQVTFQAGQIPWVPTMEGQYIIKNLIIISAALVIGGTVRER
jgi:uncharacterized membrane protein YphA (DoxX/SURF4 family)